MLEYTIATTFITGLFFGSFLKVFADRELSAWGRSHCDSCKKILDPKDLIPIVSYISSRGKCRYCGTKFSLSYPLSELLTGLVFVFAFYLSGLNTNFAQRELINFVYYLIVSCFFLIIVFSDLTYQIIPDKIIIPASIFVFLYKLTWIAINNYTYYQKLNSTPLGGYLIKAGFFRNNVLADFKGLGIDLLGAILIALFFLALVVGTKGRGMGGGDIKLGFLLGLVNGFSGGVIAVLIGFISGSVISLGLIIFRVKTIKDVIPFGPFLIFGSFVSLMYGRRIFNLYINSTGLHSLTDVVRLLTGC